MLEDYEEHLSGLNDKINLLEQKLIEKDAYMAVLYEAVKTYPRSIRKNEAIIYCPSCEKILDPRIHLSQPHKENCALFRAISIESAKTALSSWKQRLSDQYQKGLDYCRRHHDELPANTMVSNEARQALDRQIADYREAERRLEREREALYMERMSLKKKVVKDESAF
jgi:hypothetical protein